MIKNLSCRSGFGKGCDGLDFSVIVNVICDFSLCHPGFDPGSRINSRKKKKPGSWITEDGFQDDRGKILTRHLCS